MFDRLDLIFKTRAPQLEPDARRRTAEVAVHLFRGLLPLIMSAAEGEELAAVTAETKRALGAYLSSVIG
ncbi:hypothetical protein GCM10029992_19070 [Glycomyces albus]